MKTKFIGLEGFEEIESLSTKKTSSKKMSAGKKTVRFVKRAVSFAAKSGKKGILRLSKKASALIALRKSKSQTAILDRHYNSNRSAGSEFSAPVSESLTKVVSVNKNKHAHSADSKPKKIVKKKAILAVAATLTAVMLSCITVAGALDAYKPVQTETKAVPATKDSAVNTEAETQAVLPELGETAFIDNPELFVTTGFSGLYIDGKLIGATAQADELQAALDQVLVDYREGYDDTTTTEFVNKVEIKSGSFSEDEKMSVDEIIALAQDKFSIALYTDWIYTTEVVYNSNVTYDDSEDSSYEKVTQEGENGEAEFTIRLTYIDGVQTDAVITDTKTIKEAVDEEIVRGSKDTGKSNNDSDDYSDDSDSYSDSESGSKSSGSGSSTGSFIWPLPHTHNITSYMEERWGRMHQGIDIAGGGDYGMPIVAADGGTVSFAGNTGGGYGNFVIIDHGNGYSTLYGHASELAVSTGQYVSQGETIAYVGSTGNSTGPHLHFEVMIDDVKVNPLNYVS